MTVQVERAPLSDTSFRSLMSRLVTCVTVATSYTEETGPKGLTCSAFMSVSADPPIIAIGVHRRSTFLDAVASARTFAVNVLADHATDTALMFASPTERRFESVAWRHSPLTSAPILIGPSILHLDCDLWDQVESGDHVVVFGQVLSASAIASEGPPLLHCQRAFGTWQGATTGNLSRTE